MKLLQLYEQKVQWKTIRDWPNYEVSTSGQVRAKKTQKLIAPWKSARRGGGTDLRVSLYRQGKRGLEKKGLRVHRLVAGAFISNPDQLPEVDHKNGNTHDNNVKNLEWVTSAENSRRRQERERLKDTDSE